VVSLNSGVHVVLPVLLDPLLGSGIDGCISSYLELMEEFLEVDGFVDTVQKPQCYQTDQDLGMGHVLKDYFCVCIRLYNQLFRLFEINTTLASNRFHYLKHVILLAF